MDSPAPRVLEAFRNEFHNIKHPAGSYPTLGGHGKTILDDKNNLMTLRKHFEEDQLTKFLRSYLAWLFVVSLIQASGLTNELHSLTNDGLTRFARQIAL